MILYRRHKPTCPYADAPRSEHNKCKCKIWADGVLGGREVRKSMRTRDWTKANREIQKWEAAERITEQGTPVTLDHAWESMMADLEARKLSDQTVRKYRLLERQMKVYAQSRGLSLLSDFDVETLGRFRSTWTDGPRTATKKLERLRALFRFAHDRSWFESNPASRLKLPKVSLRPTMPLTHADMLEILSACETYAEQSETTTAKMNAHRLRTLVLLMRYTGMRVSDAVTLTTDRLEGKRLFLYTQKTGVPVHTVVPDSVLQALEATPRINAKNYFWSGQSKRESIAGLWEKRLKNLFALAGVSKGQGNAVSHRFRDTFAVELLLAGVPIERVSVLLGHQSVRVTEKHYNPWVRSRQEQLESDVRNAWANDALLNPKPTGTNWVQLQKGRVN